ncbi:MAG TPA: DUF1553 domain-containing protein, partial [Pirellulaceae bacterium]|nr:DUF1553 domain-containing protein [Pirellulaceae bacterium]
GGPSVKPHQPPGLWEAVSYDGELSYEPDRGAGLWRRSLYTFWKRQSPPPGLLAFDGPTRETCVVRRPRTNTPLQALVLLNDVTYVAAARELAENLLATELGSSVKHTESGESKNADRRRLAIGFRRITSRQPADSELDVLATLLEKQRARFATRPELARQLLGLPATSSSTPAEHDRNVEQRAAWTVVVHAILNLDESITRR